MGAEGGVVFLCVYVWVCVSCVYAEQKVGHCLAARVLLLCCVFSRNSMFYSEADAHEESRGFVWVKK